MWELDYKAEHQRIDAFELGVWEDSWESLGLQGDPTSPFWRRSVLNVHWKDWCWSWNSNTLVTWCEELTHLKRSWCWERLRVGGEGDGRGWDGWMASLTQRTSVWVDSGCWWWQGGLDCYSSWGHKESDMTERLKRAELPYQNPKFSLLFTVRMWLTSLIRVKSHKSMLVPQWLDRFRIFNTNCPW